MPPTILLRSEHSDSAVSAIEVTSSHGFAGPPLHRHDFDQAFSIIQGAPTFQLGDEVLARTAGELAFAPRTVAP